MKAGSHDDGLFAITRGLCIANEGDVERIKRALYVRGIDKQTVHRAVHQMRVEGHIVRAQAELRPGELYLRDARAGVMHLIDLKRAGHRARFTEYTIPPDGGVTTASLRTRRLHPLHSFGGSPAAMCAEIGGGAKW